MNTIEKLLLDYKPGEPEMKPDVLKQIKEIEKEREKMMAEAQHRNEGQISITQDGKNIPLSNTQIVQILQKQQEQLKGFANLITERDKQIEQLKINENNLNNNMKKLINMVIEKDTQINEMKINKK